MQKTVARLVYFFAETHYPSKGHSALVVTIVGPLAKENLVIFRDCVEEIMKSKSKWMILNFRDVPSSIDGSYIPLLLELKESIRAKPAYMRFSGLHPELKETLKTKNVLLPEELANNLAEALESLPGLSTPNE